MDKPFATDLFADETSSEKLYLVPSWQQQMDLLGHLCQYSQNLLLLLSPKGSGKTCFTKLLADYHLPGLRKIVLDGNQINDTTDLMKAVSTGFHLPWPVEGGLKLFEESQTQDDKSLTWTVIIDNAQSLSEEVLKSLVSLMDFEQPPKQQLRVVLVGEPSLELLVSEPSIAEHLGDRIHPIELNAWTQADIEYILIENDKKISPKFIQAIHEQSAGRPVAVMDRLHLVFIGEATLPDKESKHWVQYVDKPVVFGLSLGVVLAMSFLLFNFGDDELPTSAPLNVAQLDEKANTPEVAIPDREFKPQKVFSIDEQPKQRQSSKSTQVAFEKPATTTKLKEVERQTTKVALGDNKPANKQNLVVAEKPRTEIAATAKKAESTKLAQAVAKSPTPTTYVKKTVAEKKPMTAQDGTPGLFELSNDEQTILAQSSKGYTLQLMGSKKMPDVQHFLRKNNLKNKGKLIRVNRDGVDWYVIVYGSYPSYAKAKQAAKEIAQNSRVKPWVRTNKSVQGDIKRIAEIKGGSGFVILPIQNEQNQDVG